METEIRILSAIIIILSSSSNLSYYGIKEKYFKKIMFILIHAVYHIVGFFASNLIPYWVLESLSPLVMISFGISYSGSVCFMTGVEIYVDKFKRMFPKLRLKNFANKSIPVDVLVKLINK